jgi:hypothetical protein
MYCYPNNIQKSVCRIFFMRVLLQVALSHRRSKSQLTSRAWPLKTLQQQSGILDEEHCCPWLSQVHRLTCRKCLVRVPSVG